MEIGRAGVPHRNAIGARMLEIKIGGCGSGPEKDGFSTGEGDKGPVLGAATRRIKKMMLQRSEKFQLLRVSKYGPRQTAHPGAESRVALLRVRAAIAAIIEIENAFVRRAAANIVSVAAFAVIDRVAGGG